MKPSRHFFQILQWSVIAVVVAAVMTIGILTNTTLRSIEKNLPITLLAELGALDLLIEDLAEVVSAAEATRRMPNPENHIQLRHKVKIVFDGMVKLRETYVFDNLVQASAFHAVVAPAISDTQLWLMEGVSGYGPETATTLDIALSRITKAFSKARALKHDSHRIALKIMSEQRIRLEHFLLSVNLLFLLTLTITVIMIFLIARRQVFLRRELEAQTELRRAEKTLQETEELYSKVIAAIPDIVVQTDVNGQILFLNDVALQITGYKRAEALGKNLLEFIAPENHESAVENMSLMFDRRLGPGEYSLIMKDGKKIPFEINSDVLRRNDGSPYGIVNICRDITERRQAEEKLRESEEKYRTLSNNIPDFIYSLDKMGNVLAVNNPAGSRYGYEAEMFVGKPFLDVIHPDDREMLINSFLQAIEDHREYTRGLQFRVQVKDGTVRWMELNSHMRFDEKGLYLQEEGVLRDITERKQAEEEKRSLEERLSRAEKMESLGILAGGVAHDLNNVLGIVVGYAELLLLKESKSNANRPLLVEIMSGGQKAAAIVDDLLTLARRGVSGRNVLNLNKIIADNQKSPEFANLFLHHSAVKIKTDLEPELLNISGSSVHLGKSLFNLVSNASEAMPKGGVLTIKTANQYLDNPIHGYDKIREGDYVILSVSDTGEGIHAADLKRIFEPFYTKKVMGRSGTGLGLAVVWGTVKDHNGYINVHSEEGKGSTFTLYFPVTREELSAEAVAVSISEYMGKGESILIVDDVKGQRDLAEEMLKKLNYRVTSASSGEKAVAYLKEHKTDLMVLDMIMDPGMDGLDTYRSVLEIRPKQKAIIVSGFSESDRVKATQALGAGAYVRKPYIIEKLGLAVRKELDRAA